MKVTVEFQTELEEYFDHDSLIAGLISGKLEWAVAYEIYPSERKRITEISLVPAKPGGHPKAHFLPKEVKEVLP